MYRTGARGQRGEPQTDLYAPAGLVSSRSQFAGLWRATALAAAQSAVSLAVMFVAGLTIAVGAGPYDGMITMIGWVFWSAVAALLTTVGVLVLGLPIRLIPRLRTWWADNGEITLLGLLGGAALLVASFASGHPDTVLDGSGLELPVFEPDGSLLLTGWLLLSFSCTHLRWPRRWTRWIMRPMGDSDTESDATATR